MKEDSKPLIVTIQCFTYNHENYIRQCLDGFVMQKTNFRFEAIVHDDASTDGTADIVREYADKYPDIIKPIIETENQYSKHDDSLSRIMDEHTHGKYVAICEGDDYWIDPLKLQKQVDFLESNPDFGLVYTNHYNRTGDKITIFKEKGYTSFDELLVSSGIGTLTSCYKAVLFNQYLKDVHPENKNWLMGDAPLWKYVAFHSKIKFLPDYTSVYRILENSASHSNDTDKQIAFVNSGYDIQKFFIDKYVLDEKKRIYYYQIILEKKVVRSFNIFYAKSDLEIVRKYMKEKWKFLRCRNWFVLRIKEMILWLGIKR